jgi:hypothetical protein
MWLKRSSRASDKPSPQPFTIRKGQAHETLMLCLRVRVHAITPSLTHFFSVCLCMQASKQATSNTRNHLCRLPAWPVKGSTELRTLQSRKEIKCEHENVWNERKNDWKETCKHLDRHVEEPTHWSLAQASAASAKACNIRPNKQNKQTTHTGLEAA